MTTSLLSGVRRSTAFRIAMAVALCMAVAASAVALIGIGIHAAEQQNALFRAVRDAKRFVIPARPSVVKTPMSSTTIAGHDAFLIAPKAVSGASDRPWVWYMPTLPGLPGEEEASLFKALSDAGVAVAGIDVGETYGSPAGHEAFDAFYREMTEVRGYARRPVLFARSRGGLMALSWGEQNPENVAAIAGIYPVANLASYPGVDQAADAFSTTPAALAEHLPRYNPIDNIANLAKARVPIYIIHGDSDEVVPLRDNSAILEHRYSDLGGPITLRVVPHQGHSLSDLFFEDAHLARFVIEQAIEGAGRD